MNIGDTAKLNTNPEDSPETILRLFVYGTLKRGYWNHQRFCAQARSIEPAVVWGRLYHLHAGFPALEVPEGSDPGPGHRRSTGRRPQATGDRHTAFRPPDRRLGSDPWRAGDLHRSAARSAAHRPAGRIPARRAQHVPAGDGGGAVRAHLDYGLDLPDAAHRHRE
jgi:hypothetical protein